MILGFDHVVLACHDPAVAALEIERAVGLRAAGGGHHEALGTVNRLIWLGDTYIELIGVVDPERAAGSWIGGPTLEALELGGGFATFALATNDIESDVSRLRGAGAILEGPTHGERRRPDGRLVRWTLAHPARLAPDEPPFLIEHDEAAAEWTPAERAVRVSETHPIGGAVRLARIEIAVADVHRTAMRYVRTLGITFRPSLSGGGARDASLGDQVIRLRRAAPNATSQAVTFFMRAGGAAAPRDVTLLRCRFMVEPGD